MVSLTDRSAQCSGHAPADPRYTRGMRKYLLNGALISAVLGIIPTLKKSKDANSRWTTALTWVLWLVGVALAVAAVREEAEERRLEAQ